MKFRIKLVIIKNKKFFFYEVILDNLNILYYIFIYN